MNQILWNQSGTEPEWSIVIALIVLLLLIVIEAKKKRKNRMALRVTLLSLIVISLTLIYLNPHIKTTKNSLNAVLLTENFKKRVLDSLESIYPENLEIFSLNILDSVSNAISAAGVGQIAYNYPEIDTLFIIGDAFDEYDKN